MPPAPPSSARGSATAAPSSSLFNRDAARSSILGAAAKSSSAQPAATAAKLLETLSSLSKHAAAGDKENAAASGAAVKSGALGKLGGARRVVKQGVTTPLAVINPATAATASASTFNAALTSSSAALVAAESKIAQLEREKAALESQVATLQSEWLSLEGALTSSQTQCAQRDASIAQLQQQNEQLQSTVESQAAQLKQAQSNMEQLQQEKEALVVQNAANGSSDTEPENRSASVAAQTAVECTALLKEIAAAQSNNDVSAAASTEEATAVVPPMQQQPATAEEDEEDEIVFAPAAEAASAVVAAPVAAATAAPIAPIVAVSEDDFAPVLVDDMEASLHDLEDPFALSGSPAKAAAEALAESAVNLSTAAESAVNLSTASAASLNLSLNGSVSSAVAASSASPFQLPASFMSNPASPATAAGGASADGGFLSPISSSHSPAAASAAAAAAAEPLVLAKLSASALKIQARFRGHMERQYVAAEARLAALPITSPSKQAATTESPIAKRQRTSTSPLSLSSRSAVGAGSTPSAMHMDLESEGLLEARELSFQEHEQEEEEDGAEVVPSSAASSGPAAAAASVSVSSALAPLSLADQKRIQSELRAQRPTLGSIDACWTLRSKALNKWESLLRERGPGGMAGWAAWPAELAGMQRALAAQLGDLRSSILREACRLLIALADSSPRDFEPELAFYAPLLFKGLYVTIKIISQTSDETIAEIVARVATVKSVPVFLAGLTDVHSVVREKCACYLLQIVSSVSVGDAALEAFLPALCAAIKAQTQDQDGKVRASWRSLLEGLRRVFPAQMDAFVTELPQPVQKALEMDRKAKAGSTSAKLGAGAKRKK